MNELWYRQPAQIWEEALPVGNGSLGGMIYGGVQEETVSLNKDTLWSGKPLVPAEKRERLNRGRAQLCGIREHLLREEYAAARDDIEASVLGDWSESYLPLADLQMSTSLTGEIKAYRRELDLECGVVKTSFLCEKKQATREYICSHPANALLVHCHYEQPVDVMLRLSCQMRHSVHSMDGCLMLDGECPVHVEPDYMDNIDNAVLYGEGSIHFRTGMTVVCEDGDVISGEGCLYVRSARDFTIYLVEADSFRDYCTAADAPYQDVCAQHLAQVCKTPYAQHKAAHIKDYQALYERMHFSLETAYCSDDIPTEERLVQFAQNEKDIALFPLLVQYGRYLTIAASRPGSQAMNLQGIWSRNLRAVWSSNYTMNINTQMNYWPTLACALPELQEPLTVLVRDISKAGRDTAKELYGCKGWVSHHNTDLWRMTIPAGGAWKRREGFSAVRHSMWPMSGAWVCRHLYDQYEYTQDLAFLRDTAYDILKGSAEFALDWLVELPDGTLGTLPSTSPENEFVVDGEPYAASISSTMDISILRELFENCLACIETLSVNDAVFETRLRTALERLPQIRAASDGRIAEWSREYDENEVNHRHVSHLYGLYPADIMPEALKPACRLSLEKRGDEGTGWSLAWKTCLWARLQDADAAYRLLKRQLKPTQGKTVEYTNGGIYNNLLMAHPPFQIDANFGITAAILEMLVQCRNGCVFLLAALPRAWPTGKIEGVAIKGGAKISMHWRDGVLETLCVSMCGTENAAQKTERFCYGGKQLLCTLSAQREQVYSADDFRLD